jgi:tetratricopeptide (TPR) repeat protein
MLHVVLLKSVASLAALVPAGTALEEATRAFQAGDYAKVLELSATVGTSDADHPRLAYLAGEAELALDAPAEAEKAFRAVLAQRPKAVPAQVGLGRALTELERFDEAASTLTAALAAAPDDVGALTAQGLLLSVRGKRDEARVALVRASKLDPKSALVARGHVEVLLRADDVPAAAAVAEAFLAARPEHPMGPFLMGWVMERDAEDEQALEQYERALALDATFLDAHKNLAILCHTLSNTYQDKARTKLAFAHYERYFALGGKDAALRAMYDNLVNFKDQILGS